MQDVAHIIAPLSRGLPKTLVETSYRAGDDGEHEAGWWQGLLNASNRDQYVVKALEGVFIVIDRATGLMWPQNGGLAGCFNGVKTTWSIAIDYANGLTFAGYSDWRVPNVKELHSILDFSRVNPCIDNTYFSNTRNDRYWTSTTYSNGTSNAWYVHFSYPMSGTYPKINTTYLRCVRGGL